jgi:hypothetical protein
MRRINAGEDPADLHKNLGKYRLSGGFVGHAAAFGVGLKHLKKVLAMGGQFLR